jgi:hypothetical protein
VPETIASELITATDFGLGGASNLALQKGQKLLTNQRDFPQFGHFMVFPIALFFPVLLMVTVQKRLMTPNA